MSWPSRRVDAAWRHRAVTIKKHCGARPGWAPWLSWLPAGLVQRESGSRRARAPTHAHAYTGMRVRACARANSHTRTRVRARTHTFIPSLRLYKISVGLQSAPMQSPQVCPHAIQTAWQRRPCAGPQGLTSGAAAPVARFLTTPQSYTRGRQGCSRAMIQAVRVGVHILARTTSLRSLGVFP